MARKIQARWLITGSLRAESPVHVGGLEHDAQVDLTLARDGRGQRILPGTSLAGVLIAWLRERGCAEAELKQLFGASPEDEDKGQASLVVVDDGLVTSGVEEIQEGVGIDRVTGAAAGNFLYSRAVLAVGSEIEMSLTAEFVSEEQEQHWGPRLSALLGAMTQGDFFVGAATNAGLGRLRLIEPQITRQVFGAREPMLSLLRSKRRGERGGGLMALPEPAQMTRPSWELTVNFSPDGPLMVKASQDGDEVDGLPRVTRGEADEVYLALPGRSIRGALRSCAERIVRTVLGEDAPRGSLLEQVKVPLVEHLFGAAGEDDKKRIKAEPRGDEREGEAKTGKGALRVSGSLGGKGISRGQWRAIQSAASPEELRTSLDAAGWTSVDQAFHVAIDRWTGGPAEHLLFSVLEPRGLSWTPLSLSLDLARLPKYLRQPAVMLMLLVVRQLGRGEVPVGYGTMRGFGAVRIDKLTSTTTGIEGTLSALSGVGWDPQERRLIAPGLDVVQQGWKEAIIRRFKAPAIQEEIHANP